MNNCEALQYAKDLKELAKAPHMVTYGAYLKQAACIIEKLVGDKINISGGYIDE